MNMTNELDQWLKDQNYLPGFIRDFHDQKDLFKAMFHAWGDQVDENGYLNGIGWVNAHVFTVDYFLWYMAKRGYTLQKSRAKQEFIPLTNPTKGGERNDKDN